MPNLPELSERAQRFGALTFNSMQLGDSIACDIDRATRDAHDVLTAPPLTLLQVLERCSITNTLAVMGHTSIKLPHKPNVLFPLVIATLGDILVSESVLPLVEAAKLQNLAKMLQSGTIPPFAGAQGLFQGHYARLINESHALERKTDGKAEENFLASRKLRRQASFYADLQQALLAIAESKSLWEQSRSWVSWFYILNTIAHIVEVAELPLIPKEAKGQFSNHPRETRPALLLVKYSFWNRYAAWCPIDI